MGKYIGGRGGNTCFCSTTNSRSSMEIWERQLVGSTGLVWSNLLTCTEHFFLTCTYVLSSPHYVKSHHNRTQKQHTYPLLRAVCIFLPIPAHLEKPKVLPPHPWLHNNHTSTKNIEVKYHFTKNSSWDDDSELNYRIDMLKSMLLSQCRTLFFITENSWFICERFNKCKINTWQTSIPLSIPDWLGGLKAACVSICFLTILWWPYFYIFSYFQNHITFMIWEQGS